MKFASEHLNTLDYFEDEISLQKHLLSDPGFTLLPDELPSTSSPTEACLNNSNQSQSVTSHSERGKEKVPFDDEMIYSTNYNQENVSFHPPNLQSPHVLNLWSVDTEAGTSSQAAEPLLDACGLTSTSDFNIHNLEESEFVQLLGYVSAILYECLNNECHATDSDCTIARTRWTNVSKLLRRNSVRERIGISQGNQPLKKQKCC